MQCPCGNKIDGSVNVLSPSGKRLCSTCAEYEESFPVDKPTKEGIVMKKSWKTTLGGILIGLAPLIIGMESPEWASQVGVIVGAIGGVLLGVSARDHNVSSEDAGAHKKD